ncbi:putative GAJ protein, partial [Aspergillus homomorphus CBS 101889]
QPPKLTKSAKQALIVAYLRASRTCHTLKDLEKSLPAVASINAIQVKEFLQELADENEIHVEKIGSLNWYWCFGREAKREREARLARLVAEVERVRGAVVEVGGKIRERRAALQREDEDGEDGDGDSDKAAERERLMLRKTELQEEIRQLRRRLAAVSGQQHPNGKGVEGKSLSCVVEETEEFRRQALMWTENIYVLEGFVNRVTGGDREVLRAVQRECYGEEEYVDGEGLREIF